MTSEADRLGFRCLSEPGEFAVRIVPSGELDAAHVEELDRAVDEALGRDIRGIVLDLSELDFIDSTGLGALVRLEERARGSGRELVFARPTVAVRKILRIVGLDRRFRLSDDEPEPRCPICDLPLASGVSRCPHCGSRLP